MAWPGSRKPDGADFTEFGTHLADYGLSRQALVVDCRTHAPWTPAITTKCLGRTLGGALATERALRIGKIRVRESTIAGLEQSRGTLVAAIAASIASRQELLNRPRRTQRWVRIAESTTKELASS